MPNKHNCQCKKGALPCGCCPLCVKNDAIGHKCDVAINVKRFKRKAVISIRNYNEDSSSESSESSSDDDAVAQQVAKRPKHGKREENVYRRAFKGVYGEDSMEYKQIITKYTRKKPHETVQQYLEDRNSNGALKRAGLLKRLHGLFLEICKGFLGSSAEDDDVREFWDRLVEKSAKKSEEVVRKAVSRAVSIYRTLPTSSIEIRVALSVLDGLAQKTNEIQHVSALSPVPIPDGIGRVGRSKGLLEWNGWRRNAFDDNLCMMQGNLLRKKGTSVQYKELVVQSAVEFIISDEVVQHINCKARNIKLKDDIVTIPSLIRLYSKEDTWRLYYRKLQGQDVPTEAELKEIQDERKEQGDRGEPKTPVTPSDMISRTSLYDLLGALTVQQRKQHGDVEFTHGVQLNYRLGQIIDWVSKIAVSNSLDLTADDWKKRMYRELSAVDEFLKKDFKTHVGRSDSCAFHSRDFALEFGHNIAEQKVTCEPCSSPFRFLEKLSTKARELADNEKCPTETATTLNQVCQITLHEAAKSFKLLMGHKFRSVIQRNAYLKYLKELDCESAVLIMDYKMKILPESNRESQSAFFGKTGAYCHGVAILWKKQQQQHEQEEAKESQSYQQALSSGLYEVHYLIQLIEETDMTKQDSVLVYSCIEDALRYIRDSPRLQHIKQVILQSDNVGNYNNNFIVAAVPIISKRTGITILKFIHNEPGDGKTILDSFFGVVTWRIKQRIREIGCDTTLIDGLARAISGLRNSTVQELYYKAHNLLRDKDNLPYPLVRDWCATLTASVKIPNISRHREWSYTGTIAHGFIFSGDTIASTTLHLENGVQWNEIMEEALSSKETNTLSSKMSSKTHYSNFDGYMFKASSVQANDLSNEERISDNAANDEYVKKFMCSNCNRFFPKNLTQHMKCCKGVQEEKFNLCEYGIKHAISLIHNQWRILEDGSTRIIVDTNVSTNNNDANEYLARNIKRGWASSPPRRRTSDAVKSFINKTYNSYARRGKRLTMHKAVALLHKSEKNGLPMFMPIHYISITSVLHLIKEAQKIFQKERGQERLQEQRNEEIEQDDEATEEANEVRLNGDGLDELIDDIVENLVIEE